MSIIRYQTLMAGMLCMALAACSSMGSQDSGNTAAAPSNPANGNPAVDSGPGNAASSGEAIQANRAAAAATPMAPSSNTMAPPAGAADAAQAGTMAVYGVVQTIDAMPRAQALSGAAASMDSSGGSGMAATGAGNGNDMVYRITLKLDDGSMRAFMQESQPAVQIGDRVRVANGAMQRN